MTPPRLARNRNFFGLNVATLLIYAGVSIMFFLVPFDLVDRRGLPSTDAGLAFLPFTLGVGLLSRLFGSLADAIGARAMLIAGPVGAALAYVWLALAHDGSLTVGVLGPMALLGVSFAVLVAPLTASVMSSVSKPTRALRPASTMRLAVSRSSPAWQWRPASEQLSSGYQVGLIAAAVASVAGALVVAFAGAANTRQTRHPRLTLIRPAPSRHTAPDAGTSIFAHQYLHPGSSLRTPEFPCLISHRLPMSRTRA